MQSTTSYTPNTTKEQLTLSVTYNFQQNKWNIRTQTLYYPLGIQTKMAPGAIHRRATTPEKHARFTFYDSIEILHNLKLEKRHSIEILENMKLEKRNKNDSVKSIPIEGAKILGCLEF